MSAGQRARPRVRDGPSTRKRILDAGERLFAREGFDAVGTARLAREARVTIGALYHHFPSKEALYEATTRRALSARAQPPAELLRSSAPAEQRLTRLVAWFVRTFMVDESFGLLLKRELLDPRPSTKHLVDAELFQQPLELCRELLRELLPGANADQAVASLLALLFGFSNLRGIHALLPGVRSAFRTPDEIAAHVTRLLLHGARGRAGVR
jgi:AcrR family transcriptional regulator